MRRKLTLLLLLLTCILTATPASAQAQPASRLTNPWWFGVNFGATWQTSDMKTVPGFGWGLTLSKMSRYRENRALWWGARFRFLDGVNYGKDYTRFHGIANDKVLNGTNDSTMNYVANGGYIYSNYRTRLDELAFELQVGSNALRKHGILLYGWGGLGITKATTTINQRDNAGNLYNYSMIDSTGNRAAAESQLNSMWDKSYETVADGSQNATWTFMPSAGLGIGKTFNNRVGVAFEHKITFTLDNLIDGRRYDNANIKDSRNDWYHYTGVKLIWRFRPETERTLPTPPTNNPTDPNTYTNNPNNNPNNPNNPTNPTVINTNPNNNPQNTLQPPNVRITTPAQNPYYTSVPTGQLTAQVTNVTSAGQIRLTVNGYQNSNFSWNQSTQMLSFNYNLLQGNNSFVITATNQVGSDTETETIILQQAQNNPMLPPPQVTITNPSTNPFTSASSTMNVNATVLNVNGAADIKVRRNGAPITNFTYNGTTKQVTFLAQLQNGSNLYEVIGTNTVGSATGSVTIMYNTVTPQPTGQPPVVTITNPSSCPTQSKVQSMTITATVLNVNSTGEITVTFNGQPVTGYNWNGTTKQLSFPATLTPGTNYLVIGAANNFGKDVKNCQITYKASLPAPQVTITNPGSNPYNTTTAPLMLSANVINVNSQNEITVTMNNQPFTSFNYNMSTKVLTLNTTLNQGTTVFTVTASNAGGTDSKSQTVIYTPTAPAMQPPVVTITNPTTNPYIQNNTNVFVTATVLNVTSSSQIQVSAIGRGNLNFNFNAASHILTFSDVLQAGARSYTITATNQVGSDSKSTTIKVVQQSGGTGATGSTGKPNDPVKNPGGGGGTISGGGSGGISTGGVSGSGSVGGSGSTGSTGTGGSTNPSDPVITLVTPSSTSYTTSSTSLSVTAQVTGVNDASGISVRVNGLRLMNYSYSNGTLTFTANLNSGSNSIEMKAQNSIGFATKTISVTVTGSGNKTGSGKTGTTTIGGGTKSGSSGKGSTGSTGKGSTGSSGSQKNPEPRKTGTTTGDGKGNTTSTPKTTTPTASPAGGKGAAGKGG